MVENLMGFLNGFDIAVLKNGFASARVTLPLCCGSHCRLVGRTLGKACIKE